MECLRRQFNNREFSFTRDFLLSTTQCFYVLAQHEGIRLNIMVPLILDLKDFMFGEANNFTRNLFQSLDTLRIEERRYWEIVGYSSEQKS